ncbi:MAG: hypothetical protein Q7S81_02380 [bacterium]|nr:hypothetical protein [bacterium]
MKRKDLFILITFLAAVMIVIFAVSRNPDWFAVKKDDSIILYAGTGCPHCANVEKYIKENQVDSKITFTQKEVYNNQFNAKDLQSKAKICGLPTDSIGVPFLWDGENAKCFMGDVDVINFFQEKTK